MKDSWNISRNIRNFLSIFAWIWAILVFVVGYYGQGAYNNNNNELNQHVTHGFSVSPLGRQGRAQIVDQGGQGASSNQQQYMIMNPDGQYSFAYSSPDSSRNERRHLDGTVEGKYSYRNPEGKLVEVQYQADSRGFKTLPNQVIEDTPAVKDARQKFFEVYAKELARINSGTVQIQSDQPQAAIVVSDDTEVVHAAPEVKLAPISSPSVPAPVQKSSAPAYFYYVGVGDFPKPYYVISPVRESTNIAVSVRASQLGAIPADAVHDAQVPKYGKTQQVQQNSVVTRPVYIELGGDYQLPHGLPMFPQKSATSPAVLQYQRPYYFVQ